MIENRVGSFIDTLDGVDQYMNIKLGNVEVVDKERFPQLVLFGFPCDL